MGNSPGNIEAHDVTLRVDAAGPSGCGSRDYEVGNDALVDQEAIRKGGPDTVEAQDVTGRVDITWQGGCGPWDVNGGEVKHLGTGWRESRQHHHERVASRNSDPSHGQISFEWNFHGLPPVLLEEIILNACSPSDGTGVTERRKRPRL
jgi:hypothetical protein